MESQAPQPPENQPPTPPQPTTPPRPLFSTKRLAIIGILGAVLCAGVYFGSDLFVEKEKELPKLKVGGTSVVSFMMDKWGGVYEKEKHVKVEYESTGSTEGLNRLIDKTYAIGFTHAPMSANQRKQANEKGGEVVHIPVVLCGVVPAYNLKELKDKPPLNFTADVLAKIFLGEIKEWDHSELQALNKNVKLPKVEIKVVYREDSSGTTLIFTEYLNEASALWRAYWKQKNEKGEGSKLNWPVGQPKPRSNGVATYLESTEGTIGCLDLLHAKGRYLSYGAVQNSDNKFVHAEPENLTAAANALVASIPEDLTFKLTNKPGADSYPIAGAVWAVCYRNQGVNQKAVVDFLNWTIHDGQRFAKDRTYAPLPKEFVDRAEQKVKSIGGQ